MELFKVIKRFEASGELLINGDIVDASSWKYKRNLVSLRYIEPAPEATEESRVEREVAIVVIEEQPAPVKKRRTAEQARDAVTV